MTATPETRSTWQIEQGKKCGCRGSDEYCPCQNTNSTTPARAEAQDEGAVGYRAALIDDLRRYYNDCTPPQMGSTSFVASPEPPYSRRRSREGLSDIARKPRMESPSARSRRLEKRRHARKSFRPEVSP